MNGRDFYTRVNECKDLEWMASRDGATPADDVAIVRHRPTDAKFAIAVSAIQDHSWDELFAVVTGARPPRIMTHITRIVGYYSMIQNWNRSKIAELRDRHKGDYVIPKDTPQIHPETSAGRSAAIAS